MKNYKGKNNHNWKGDKAILRQKYYCTDCKKRIAYGSKRCYSCENKRKYKLNIFNKCGKNNPMYNKKHSEKTKQKISKIRIKKGLAKGKSNPMFDVHRYGKEAPNWGKIHTKLTKRKMSLAMGGTGIPYEFNEYPEEYFKIRYWILKRDNHTCQNCLEYGNEVHHIDYNKENNNGNNLICLCRKCNIRANYNKDYWYAYFTYIIKEKHLEKNKQI